MCWIPSGATEKYLLPFGGGYYFVLPGATGGYIGRTMLA
jgi:deferrochelatase/peroxidase EfeB